jgi:hypothetical protein
VVTNFHEFTFNGHHGSASDYVSNLYFRELRHMRYSTTTPVSACFKDSKKKLDMGSFLKNSSRCFVLCTILIGIAIRIQSRIYTKNESDNFTIVFLTHVR